jgi:hypothetical protein
MIQDLGVGGCCWYYLPIKKIREGEGMEGREGEKRESNLYASIKIGCIWRKVPS